MGIGLAIALLFLFIGPLNWVGQTLATLVHEMGHWVVMVGSGYLAFPSFDLSYGGGLTMAVARPMLLRLGLYTVWGMLIYRYHKNRLTLGLLIGGVALYSLIIWTHAHRTLSSFIGHGTELIIATVFLYRALAGKMIKIDIERPMYAGLGLFLVVNFSRFCISLMTDRCFKAEYVGGKGGGLTNDLVRLSRDFPALKLEGVAFVMLLCCGLALIAAVLWARYREYFDAWQQRLKRA